MLDHYLALGDSTVSIRYSEGERDSAEEAYAVLGEKLPSTIAYFDLSEAFPQVTVVLVSDRNEFDRLVRNLLKIEIEVPSHPARIAQPQKTDMVVLSPSAYEEHSTFTYVPDDFGRLLVHELVHMIEEHLSPDIEASSRWWGEGLAVYLSGQWRLERGFRQPVLDGIAAGEIPSFSDIESEARLAYDWGWTIVAFIEDQYGRDTILRIVRQCSDGDVFSFLNERPADVEKRWRGWLAVGTHLGDTPLR